MAGERLGIDVLADLNAVADDGQIHFSVLPRLVAKNRHPLDRISA